MKSQAEINRYEFIDALRGFAILAVIFAHTLLIIPPSLPLLRLIASRGVFGVQLFYVVSALTLFLSLQQRSQFEKKPTRNFFIRRFFRIAPLFYLALIFYTWMFGTGPNYWAPQGIHWWDYVTAVLFVNGWHPETINSIIPLGWSIAVEMTFYLVLPFIYRVIKNSAAAVMFIVGSLILQAILMTLYQPVLLQYSPAYIVSGYFEHWIFSQLPIFGLGILAYQIIRDRKPVYDKALGLALVLAAMFLIAAFLNVDSYANLIPMYAFFGGIFLLFTLGLYFNPHKLFVNRVTQWIGKVSYSLYFIHYPTLLTVKHLIVFPSSIGRTTQFFLYFFIALISASCIAFVTYHLIEVPGMELGKKLIRCLESRDAQLAA